MKHQLLTFVLLALTFTASASAETVHATIPFDFAANGKLLPAGTYTVRTISGGLLLFVNESTNEKALAFARTSLPGKSSQALTIRTTERSYELNMPSGSAKSVLLTLKPVR